MSEILKKLRSPSFVFYFFVVHGILCSLSQLFYFCCLFGGHPCRCFFGFCCSDTLGNKPKPGKLFEYEPTSNYFEHVSKYLRAHIIDILPSVYVRLPEKIPWLRRTRRAMMRPCPHQCWSRLELINPCLAE